jgi:hypothetical protein
MKSTLFAAIAALGLVVATPVFAMTTAQAPQTATGGFSSNQQNSTKTANAEIHVDDQQRSTAA